MTLTDFLLARIAEDEAVANGLNARDVFAPTQGPDMARIHEDDEYAALGVGAGRVLAECEAKRRIVERCDHPTDDGELQEIGWELLGHLAAIYADHPDYNEAWRP